MKVSLRRLLFQDILPAVVIGLAAAFIVFCCFAAAVPLAGENTVNVYDSTVRLRVVANSDSEQDQALKLAVRNDIIGLAAEIFADCTDIEQAKEVVRERLPELEDAAARSVALHGADYPVRVRFGTEVCPVRRYSEFTFPAGEYLTLRIDIGEGAGQNWWCVMYPPLCVSAAANDVYADRETFLAYGFSERQVEKLSGCDEKPQIRSALVDFLSRLGF